MTAAPVWIVVTGANKGIGLALVRAILEHHTDTGVYLGSRDVERGRSARDRGAEFIIITLVRQADARDVASVKRSRFLFPFRVSRGNAFDPTRTAHARPHARAPLARPLASAARPPTPVVATPRDANPSVNPG